jgi:hypothetical protein
MSASHGSAPETRIDVKLSLLERLAGALGMGAQPIHVVSSYAIYMLTELENMGFNAVRGVAATGRKGPGCRLRDQDEPAVNCSLRSQSRRADSSSLEAGDDVTAFSFSKYRPETPSTWGDDAR